MTSAFENEAIRYCFLNAHQHLVWCSYRAIRICLAEWWELVQSWKHSYVGLANARKSCSRDKYSLAWRQGSKMKQLDNFFLNVDQHSADYGN